MKKIFLFALLALIFTTSTFALATSSVFTDEQSFGGWFAPSVRKMAINGVITGYPDGSFRPMDFVNRAELAVILDRYSTQKYLVDESPVCTTDLRAGVKLIIRDHHMK